MVELKKWSDSSTEEKVKFSEEFFKAAFHRDPKYDESYLDQNDDRIFNSFFIHKPDPNWDSDRQKVFLKLVKKYHFKL